MAGKQKTDAAPATAVEDQQPLLGDAAAGSEELASGAQPPADLATTQDPPSLDDEHEPEVEYVEVLVLRDEPAYGLRCGETAVLDSATAEQLHKSAGVDFAPAAVAAGKANQPQPAAPDVIED